MQFAFSEAFLWSTINSFKLTQAKKCAEVQRKGTSEVLTQLKDKCAKSTTEIDAAVAKIKEITLPDNKEIKECEKDCSELLKTLIANTKNKATEIFALAMAVVNSVKSSNAEEDCQVDTNVAYVKLAGYGGKLESCF